MGIYLKAGASGFGLGSALYKAGVSAPELAERAHAFSAAWQAPKP
jgi:2-dehydro-3-deoxyphosphogalactonate aldolase